MEGKPHFKYLFNVTFIQGLQISLHDWLLTMRRSGKTYLVVRRYLDDKYDMILFVAGLGGQVSAGA